MDNDFVLPRCSQETTFAFVDNNGQKQPSLVTILRTLQLNGKNGQNYQVETFPRRDVGYHVDITLSPNLLGDKVKTVDSIRVPLPIRDKKYTLEEEFVLATELHFKVVEGFYSGKVPCLAQLAQPELPLYQ